MDERSTGLVLRVRPLTETSLIVQWLTRDFGRISTVAKGARRPKSPFRGKLDLFYVADFAFQRSHRSELHNLREVCVQDFQAELRQDVRYLQQAAYFVQLIEQSTEVETPLPRFLDFMLDALSILPQASGNPVTVFAFELKLLQELGLPPALGEADMTVGAKEILVRCACLAWPKLIRLQPTAGQIREISRFLEHFIAYHLGRTTTTRTAALAG